MAPTVATSLRVTWRWQMRSATCTSLQRDDKEQSDNGPSRSLGGADHRIPRLLHVRSIVVLLLLRSGYEPYARQESGTVMSGIESTASFCRQSHKFHSWTQDIFARTAATASKWTRETSQSYDANFASRFVDRHSGGDVLGRE